MLPYLSVVIPAYNEEKRLPTTLEKVLKYFNNQDYPYEIIVVDDGSIDNTSKLVSSRFPLVTLLTYKPNKGKGYAVKKGMMHAKGKFRMFYDADGSTPIEEIDKIWPYFDKGIDIVIGSRGLPESQIVVHQTWIRENMGRFYNKILKMLSLTHFSDTQCGFKAMTAEVVDKVFPHVSLHRFSFDAELLFLAEKMGFQIVEIPVRWINSPQTRVKLFSDSIRMLLGAFGIRMRWLLGIYKLNS